MARFDYAQLKREIPLDAERNSYQTPKDLYQDLDSIFNFTVDACANSDNALHPNYWTVEDDAREQSWVGHTVFCNPPYSNVRDFIELGVVASTAVFLLPVRTRTMYWQEIIFKKAHSILFMGKSPKFVCPVVGEQLRAPFDVAIVVFKKGYEGHPEILSGDVSELREFYQGKPLRAVASISHVTPKGNYQTLLDVLSSKENFHEFVKGSNTSMETLREYLENLNDIVGELEQKVRVSAIEKAREQIQAIREELALNGVNKDDTDKVMLEGVARASRKRSKR